jgi:hypothetical protein
LLLHWRQATRKQNRARAISHDALRAALRKYNRLAR